jgi:hypothetical protein
VDKEVIWGRSQAIFGKSENVNGLDKAKTEKPTLTF